MRGGEAGRNAGVECERGRNYNVQAIEMICRGTACIQGWLGGRRLRGGGGCRRDSRRESGCCEARARIAKRRVQANGLSGCPGTNGA